MLLFLGIALALIADRCFGELARGHPLVGFGKMATILEMLLRGSPGAGAVAVQVAPWQNRCLGALGWVLLVLPPTLLLYWLQRQVSEMVSFVVAVAVLYFCVGWRSLVEHARAIAAPLAVGRLDQAQEQLARIVSRDTAVMDAESVTGAALESVLENGSDAVVAPLLWFLLAGAPGALAYRLVNTLDAMWGYRNVQYEHFGWAAARADDALNYIPARVCALAYALVGRTAPALQCWREQAPLLDSPNAGPVMAAGAGALHVRIGGPACYSGKWRERPVLGVGRTASDADISRALALLRSAVLLMLLLVALGELLW